jgi:hypothetical protein
MTRETELCLRCARGVHPSRRREYVRCSSRLHAERMLAVERRRHGPKLLDGKIRQAFGSWQLRLEFPSNYKR